MPRTGGSARRHRARIGRFAICLLVTALASAVVVSTGRPAAAAGSRNLFPATATGSRANLEWRTSSYGGGLLERRTLIQVFANAGEQILMGSTGVGVGEADILVFDPGTVTGPIGQEVIPVTPDFSCEAQRPDTTTTNIGRIRNRTQELAGPLPAAGGYEPCRFSAPTTGIYSVIMIGPNGRDEDANADENADVGADVALTNAANFDTRQRTSVAAWDVTVRATATSTADIRGRVFSYYLAIFTGGNGRPVNSTYYTASTDGLRYSVSLGIDGNGFVVYGNSAGFLDAGSTPAQPRPLYHDVLAANQGTPAQLTHLVGGVSLAPPEYPIFFEPPAAETLQAIGIPLTPTLQTPSSASFVGTAGGSTSNFGTGGTFSFTVDAPGVYTMVISQDGVSFDPAEPANRQVRIVARAPGLQSVTWDGLTNAGVPFPVGGPYPVQIDGHAGEYHFPMLDVENNLVGGPVITLLNPPNGVCPPWNGGCRGAFYDDRGYISGNGTAVGTPGQVLCAGIGKVSTPPNSDPVLGFDTATAQRAFGDPTGGNANVPCAAGGSFGDTKGVDLWTFYPGGQATTALSIIANTPSVATSASSPPGIQVGETVTVTDTAQLTSFNSLAANAAVEFSLVGPVADPGACPSAPVVLSPLSAPVDPATGTASVSRPFTPPAPGSYYWVARFPGDPGNLPAGPTGCGDPAELVTVVQATPTLSTQIAVISNGGAGGPVVTSDTATLTGAGNLQPGGTVTFWLVGPTAGDPPVCPSTDDALLGPITAPVDPATGTAESGEQTFTPAAAGDFYWIAQYSGDANNEPTAESECPDPAEHVVVGKTAPTMTTAATVTTPAPVVGSPVVTSDTATLSGTTGPLDGAEVTFWLVGPVPPGSPTCALRSSSHVAPITAPVDPATGIAQTGPVTFTPSLAGDYYWIAEFGGNAANGSVTTACPDPAELVQVGKATPTVTTAATVSPDDPVVNQEVTTADTATVVGAVNPEGTGTMTFWLVGPSTGDPPACPSTDAALLGPITQPIAPDGSATTGPATFTPTQPGDYYWLAEFGGDANNNATSPTGCGDPAELVHVRAAPTMVTAATTPRARVLLTVQTQDSAQLLGTLGQPTGTMTFWLVGPLDDPSSACPPTSSAVLGPIEVPVDPATGRAMTGPQSFTPTATGDYYWVARYNGDANNAPFTAPCPDPLERVEVVPATPAISTQASTDGDPTLGETVDISDTATLTELIPTQPGDTITFWLVGPVSGEPPACPSVADAVIGPLAQPLDPATATATTGPQPFTPVVAGDYYWVAQYTGDANNGGAIGGCPDAAELVTVPPATPTLATRASPATGTPGVTQDTATVGGGFDPTGTVTFRLYGPGDPACAGTPLATFLDVALVDGSATSPAVATEAVGTYRWVATYNGDANNVPVTGSCDDPAEHTTVLAPDDPDTGTEGTGLGREGAELGAAIDSIPRTGLPSTFTIWFGPFDLAVALCLLGTLLIVGSRFARRRSLRAA